MKYHMAACFYAGGRVHHVSNFMPARVSNYLPSCTVEVWDWKKIHPSVYKDVIGYPCWDWSWITLVLWSFLGAHLQNLNVSFWNYENKASLDTRYTMLNESVWDTFGNMKCIIWAISPRDQVVDEWNCIYKGLYCDFTLIQANPHSNSSLSLSTKAVLYP